MAKALSSFKSLEGERSGSESESDASSISSGVEERREDFAAVASGGGGLIELASLFDPFRDAELEAEVDELDEDLLDI